MIYPMHLVTDVQRAAAVYLLQYQGQRGTPKQLERLFRTVGAVSVVLMAKQRGFVVGGA